ncbi:hypothetical protein [Chelativorans intermedius]|uniref:Uncharacterized protein n=1 Tax=Chelativorans intermedius TaxID=515947 RepID=A0ABV6DBY8_9HYPH|nr:hypothetical protein [Chelativorans intermedius]MCT9000327.1 hypothetical protein [Chelativorans intermedius]
MLATLTDCGIENWFAMALMSAAGFLVLLILILAVASLCRYLLEGSRHG